MGFGDKGEVIKRIIVLNKRKNKKKKCIKKYTHKKQKRLAFLFAIRKIKN